MTEQPCHTTTDEHRTATCPECFRSIEWVRGYWTCPTCCIAWAQRPESRT